ncbi:hypothetical protein ADUPG1_007132 [Aduncisulcus paluster]|uniref:Uncharacterized protein n=1 Tax=Aduncisulcus paluster TaxID=2918883 RepID=A0ABQ5KNU5_9EUKA|nr:hypothetical protein ADUPG1_007132 [Aduncisulcus paluster]
MPARNPLTELGKKEIREFKTLPLHFDKRDTKLGLKACRKILEACPNHPETLGYQGLFHHLDGKSSGIDEVKKSIQLAPNSHMCHHTLGVLYRQDKRFKDAIKSYSKALIHDPDNIVILTDMCSLQAHIEDWKGLEVSALHLLKLRSQHRGHWICVALAKYNLGDFAGAFDIATKSLSLLLESTKKEERDCIEVHELVYFRAICLCKLKRYGDAAHCFLDFSVPAETPDAPVDISGDKKKKKKRRKRKGKKGGDDGNDKESEEPQKTNLSAGAHDDSISSHDTASHKLYPPSKVVSKLMMPSMGTADSGRIATTLYCIHRELGTHFRQVEIVKKKVVEEPENIEWISEWVSVCGLDGTHSLSLKTHLHPSFFFSTSPNSISKAQRADMESFRSDSESILHALDLLSKELSEQDTKSDAIIRIVMWISLWKGEADLKSCVDSWMCSMIQRRVPGIVLGIEEECRKDTVFARVALECLEKCVDACSRKLEEKESAELKVEKDITIARCTFALAICHLLELRIVCGKGAIAGNEEKLILECWNKCITLCGAGERVEAEKKIFDVQKKEKEAERAKNLKESKMPSLKKKSFSTVPDEVKALPALPPYPCDDTFISCCIILCRISERCALYRTAASIIHHSLSLDIGDRFLMTLYTQALQRSGDYEEADEMYSLFIRDYLMFHTLDLQTLKYQSLRGYSGFGRILRQTIKNEADALVDDSPVIETLLPGSSLLSKKFLRDMSFSMHSLFTLCDTIKVSCDSCLNLHGYACRMGSGLCYLDTVELLGSTMRSNSSVIHGCEGLCSMALCLQEGIKQLKAGSITDIQADDEQDEPRLSSFDEVTDYLKSHHSYMQKVYNHVYAEQKTHDIKADKKDRILDGDVSGCERVLTAMKGDCSQLFKDCVKATGMVADQCIRSPLLPALRMCLNLQNGDILGALVDLRRVCGKHGENIGISSDGMSKEEDESSKLDCAVGYRLEDPWNNLMNSKEPHASSLYLSEVSPVERDMLSHLCLRKFKSFIKKGVVDVEGKEKKINPAFSMIANKELAKICLLSDEKIESQCSSLLEAYGYEFKETGETYPVSGVSDGARWKGVTKICIDCLSK